MKGEKSGLIGMIPVAYPLIGEDEVLAVSEVLKSGMLAQGKNVARFEEEFASYIGVEHAVATSSGTAALDVALKAIGIGEGNEVIVPSFTFIASANSILFQGARPVFVDVDRTTFNIDPDDLLEKITPKTKAVIGVHLFGHPFDLKAIGEICDDHNLYLIEDAAQAHGAEYNGKRVGGFGTIGCFSFYATKNMTTGEGGMITTDDDELAGRCRLIRSHGEREKYNHTILGYNLRMTDIQAAIGIIQLRKLEEFNRKRIKNAEYLNRHLRMEGLITPHKKGEVKHVYHQYVIKLEDDFPMSRDAFCEYLRSNGVGCAVHYPIPIYEQPLYQQLGYGEQRCPVASALARKVLSLPVHPALTEEDLRHIIEVINNL